MLSKYFWTAAVAGAVGITLLLTPGTSLAQRRMGRGGSPQATSRSVQAGNAGRVESRNGWNGNNGWNGYYGRGYYRNNVGWGFGYPGIYFAGRPYYNGYDYWGPSGSYYSGNPYAAYYPDTTQSNYPPTVSSQLKNPNDAGFVVRVPDPNAEVWFQNYQTQQRGIERQYESEALDPGYTYTFTVRARWTQNGQPMDQTRQINARAGQNVTVDFTTQ